MNTEKFITSIKILEFLDIRGLDILLSKDKRKHLIITGKNGAGKTRLMRTLQIELTSHITSNHIEPVFEDYLRQNKHGEFSPLPMGISRYGLTFNHFDDTPVKMVYLGADRDSKRISLTGSVNDAMSNRYNPDHPDNQLMQYLINKKYAQFTAMEKEDWKTVEIIKAWFIDFEKKLSRILGYKITLRFNTQQFHFEFIKEDNSILDFDKLPSGYYALVNVLTEIISKTTPNQSAVVLIDEIETHLHVEFQKMILPLLVDFFPYIQFIVTTHSPFVVSSLSNAVICDLEKKIVTDDLSGYGYDTLVESFFGTSLISDELKAKIDRYDELEKIGSKTAEQNKEHNDLVNYLLSLPKYIPNELSLKLKTIEITELRKRK